MKIGLIGCGTIGSIIARAVDKNPKIGIEAIFDKDLRRARDLATELEHKPKIAKDFKEFLGYEWDLAVEAASQEAVKDYAERILEKGDLMIMSVGAFCDEELYKRVCSKAEEYKRKVYIPSGAIGGIDAVKSASLGRIYRVKLRTTKNPKSLGREDMERKVIYRGCAKEAAKLFPKNMNVSITLSLGGIGAEKTEVEIVSDPKAKRNIHEIYVEGEFGKLYTRVENVPSLYNPKTSHLAALSAVKTLEKIVEPIQVGT